MGKKVTVGGQRLGAGEKITQELHEYEFSTFNLEQDFKSSMAPGVLYPFLKIIGTNHDTFDIDLDSFMRTIPTRGPLMGAFKLQMDIFQVSIRLYQGVLHNNPVDLGLDANQVYLPKIIIETIDGPGAIRVEGSTEDDYQINNTALEKYLGLSGIGKVAMQGEATTGMARRKLQCIPELAYYDIFKNYYSNKQEEKAYVITPDEVLIEPNEKITEYQVYSALLKEWIEAVEVNDYTIQDEDSLATIGQLYTRFRFRGINVNPTNVIINIWGSDNSTGDELEISKKISSYLDDATEYGGGVNLTIGDDWTTITFSVFFLGEIYNFDVEKTITFRIEVNYTGQNYTSTIKLQPFALKNIDKMRSKLLACNEIGQEFKIQDANNSGRLGFWENGDGVDGTGFPYSALVQKTTYNTTWNAFKMNGLCVKTYQSDIFNNWLDSEFIDGNNGINSRTAVAVINGSFTLDSLAMSKKVWTLMNRILVSDNTYEGWQEARYGEGAVRKSETPMYVGGMSAEIMFEEVVSTSETKIDDDKAPLGSMGGRGTQVGRKGGKNIHIKMDEPGYIIGIVSLTPRICYSQGNDWDRTELDSIDDLHAPELDGIGFQDLIVEKFAWWNTVLTPQTGGVLHRDSAGKQIAWLDYMTAYDKCYGDFASANGYAFMVLNRNYGHDDENRWKVADITTYIDPAKYNYAFAYDKLDAQNFWCRIHANVRARRKMAAQQIPNL